MPTSVTTALTHYPARYFAAWNAHQLDGVDGLLAPAFSWIDPSLPAELTDLAGAHGFFTSSWAAFPDIHFEALGEPLLDPTANRVAAEWRMTGTHTGAEFPPGVPASGRSFDVLGTDVFTVDLTDDSAGRATAIRAYYDAATLARQLGLA
ncbi:MAG TPA: nuclear transport factor 2 family protein [Pseudonocardia sp.]|nr:nuclear transport factor 2 family protein [Pseudonocardia sp.]